MLTYWKGAGSSLLVASILYLITVGGFNTPPGTLTSEYLGIASITLFNYLGCVLAFLVNATLTRIRIKSIIGSTVIFILLGLAFSVALNYIFNSFSYKFYVIATVGSLIYYFAQFITNRQISIVLSLLGPLIALTLYLFLAF